MHAHEISNENEKKTLIVIVLTVITMIAEVFYGYITHSMALLADGYHMGTHAIALSLTYIAYILIRKFKDSELFPNGTDKIGDLAAFVSSIFLGFTGLWIIIEAGKRFISPITIQFNDAIIVAVIGLIVNGICIFVMEHSHHHEHEEYSCDNNFKAAYYHILADAMTSIFAIFALFVGKYMNIVCLDAIAGFIGGILILKWAFELIKTTTISLIDMKK